MGDGRDSRALRRGKVKQSSWKGKKLIYGKTMFIVYLKFARLADRFFPSTDPWFLRYRCEVL